MEIKLQSFFVLSLPSHLTIITTIFNFNDFIFVYVINIRFICDGEIYLLIQQFVLPRASKNCLKGKTLEAYYIKICQPSLNIPVISDRLNLYRNGVTQISHVVCFSFIFNVCQVFCTYEQFLYFRLF